MNLDQLNNKFAGLKREIIIQIECEHPECNERTISIRLMSARRNIMKNNGKFICGTCDKRFNNAMTKVGQGRSNLGDISVSCPDCNQDRIIKGVCYFGPLEQPYKQICNSCSQTGKVISEEQKQKISDTLSGRELTEEHKNNISNYMKTNEEGIQRGKNNLVPGHGAGWNRGQETPQEVRDKQSAALLGRTYSDEHKLNISDGRKKMLEETGGFSLEHRQKLREAALRQYEKGFNPNTNHRSGWHDSSKAGRVFHRSSYEKKAYMILDEMESVVNYKVESIRLNYWNPLEKTEATFIVDIEVLFNDGTKTAIEVKPNDWLSSLVNIAKIDALKIWVEKENYGCEIWDEFALFGEENTYQKVQQFIDWIDSGASGNVENVNPDVIEMRRAKGRIRANRYYKNNLSDKIEVFCDNCKIIHEVREVTYKQHMEKYGKYMCASLYGQIGGKNPKKKKENPHAAEGKKQCNACKDVLEFIKFGVDKTKFDGYSTRCSKCRAEASAKKYNENKKVNENG